MFQSMNGWRRFATGPALALGATFALLTAWTWRRLPDVLIDFGRELYVPWQLSEGAVLYRDVAYFNGPLSPYLNAAWFRLAGVSITSLMVANLLVLAVTTWLLYRLALRVFDAKAAWGICLVFLTVFAFGHLCIIGNYNYVCPYSHEMTHGLLLSLVMVERFTAGRQLRMHQFVVGGLCLGLIYLGKPETFLAATVAAVATVTLAALCLGAPKGRCAAALAVMILAAALPVAVTWLLFVRAGGTALASQAVAGGWPWVWERKVVGGEFYRNLQGFSNPWIHAGEMLQALIVVTSVAATAWLADRRRVQGTPRRWLIAAAAAPALLFLAREPFPLLLHGRAMPILASVLTGLFAWLAARAEGRQRAAYFAGAIWGALSLALLVKLGLRPHLFHYGAFLAMPAALLVVGVLVASLPRWARQQHGGGSLLFRAIVGLLCLDVLGFLVASNVVLSSKRHPVGSGRDLLVADSQAKAAGLTECLAWLSRESSPHQSVLVLPEGITINYLARRESPTRYVNFMPPELAMYGESAIVESLRENPPDFVVVLSRDTREYGYDYFGATGYGEDILSWVEENYESFHASGDDPRDPEGFGFRVYRRHSSEHRATLAGDLPRRASVYRSIGSRQPGGG